MSPSAPMMAAGGGITIPPPPVTSGLLMYYPMQYQKTVYADDALITTLYDRSGNGHNATGIGGGGDPKIKHTGGYGGTNPYSVNTTNGSRWILPDTPFSGITAIEMMGTMRSQGHLRGPVNHDGGGTDQYYPFEDGNIYTNFFRTDRPGFAPPITLGNWHRMGAWSVSGGGAGSWKMYFNGVFDDLASATFTAGSAGGRWLGTYTNFGEPNFMEFGCVLFWNRKLGSTERTDMDTWLSTYPAGGL